MFDEFKQEVMKKTCIISLLMLFVFNHSIYSYDWNLIADSIASKQKEISDSIYYSKIDLYKNLRKGFCIKKHVDSTIVEGDTVIIMEYHNPYKFATNCVTWVKGKPSSFLTYDKYLNINRDFTRCYWSIYLRSLCENWNINQIRKEENEHPLNPSSPDNKAYIIATRVILKPQGDFLVDTIIFAHFYLYPRDKF